MGSELICPGIQVCDLNRNCELSLDTHNVVYAGPQVGCGHICHVPFSFLCIPVVGRRGYEDARARVHNLIKIVELHTVDPYCCGLHIVKHVRRLPSWSLTLFSRAQRRLRPIPALENRTNRDPGICFGICVLVEVSLGERYGVSAGYIEMGTASGPGFVSDIVMRSPGWRFPFHDSIT